MLFQRRAVRRLLEVLSTCLADDGLGSCVGFQLRRGRLGGIFAVALALRLCFGTVAHVGGFVRGEERALCELWYPRGGGRESKMSSSCFTWV
jgi:hypothetical protein